MKYKEIDLDTVKISYDTQMRFMVFFWQPMRNGIYGTLEEAKNRIEESNLITESLRKLNCKNNQVICYR